MADFAYNIFKANLMRGIHTLDGTDTIRTLALEAASDENADDDDVAAVLARAGTTELTSTGYARQTHTGDAVTTDDTNDRGEYDADNVTFSSVSQDAAETLVALVVFKFVTNDAGSTPMIFIDAATGLPVTPNGSDITITWDAEGIVQTT